MCPLRCGHRFWLDPAELRQWRKTQRPTGRSGQSCFLLFLGSFWFKKQSDLINWNHWWKSKVTLNWNHWLKSKVTIFLDRFLWWGFLIFFISFHFSWIIFCSEDFWSFFAHFIPFFLDHFLQWRFLKFLCPFHSIFPGSFSGVQISDF